MMKEKLLFIKQNNRLHYDAPPPPPPLLKKKKREVYYIGKLSLIINDFAFFQDLNIRLFKILSSNKLSGSSIVGVHGNLYADLKDIRLFKILGSNKLSGSSVVGVHGNLYVDRKDILETWRLRTPNEWDNMSVWCDLLQWRNEMYNAVIDAFKDHR
jgi:hypothetical protein